MTLPPDIAGPDAGIRPVWSRHREAEVISLARSGLSAAAIARRLVTTKNAIIGVLDRAARRGDYQRPSDKRPPAREPDTAADPGPSGCRFIAGDPLKPGWAYCGAPVARAGGAWCEEHHRRVYVRVPRDQALIEKT